MSMIEFHVKWLSDKYGGCCNKCIAKHDVSSFLGQSAGCQCKCHSTDPNVKVVVD